MPSTKNRKYSLHLPESLQGLDPSDYDQTLLYRLGGDDALEAVVQIFVDCVLSDEELKPFFEGVNSRVLMAHQQRFLRVALQGMPEDFDATGYMIERHFRLFEKGLNENDIFLQHLGKALDGLWVEPSLVAETKARLAPFRKIFEKSNRERASVGKRHQKSIEVARAKRSSQPSHSNYKGFETGSSRGHV